MKVGDLVKYATNDIEHQIGNYPKTVQKWHKEGLLVAMVQKRQRQFCEILDNKSGRIVKKHVADVRPAKEKHESR